MKFDFDLNDKGHIKRRESFDLEFKANFHLGNQLLEYCRSLVGMANNKGGQIVFGIRDRPRFPDGMTNNKFIECDPAKVNQALLEYFSQEIEWEMETLEFSGKNFGILSTKEASKKPILCKKNGDKILREAAIYYRYRGETKEIQFAELDSILQNERQKEKLLWMQHIQKISSIGPQHVHLLDSYNGEITVGSGKILLDKNVLDKLKFIKEGNFTEKVGQGLPTLKLVGNIEGLVETGLAISSDITHPLFTKDLQEKLQLNGHQIKCLVWKLQLKGNSKFHITTKSGQNSNTQKYSEAALNEISKAIKGSPDYLKVCEKEYKEMHPAKKRAKKSKSS